MSDVGILKAAKLGITVGGVSAFLIIALIFPCTCPNVQAQSSINFTPTDKFDIPSSNGTISFAFNGTYTQASLIDDAWTFADLHLDNSHPLEKLEVSAQNSNVTIITYRIFNTAFRGALLSYTVEGEGKQTFNIGLPLTEGEWSVLLEEEFMGEGDGWHVTPDATLTITDAKSDVTIWYFGFPESFDVDGGSDKPFHLQHSVAIATAVALAITATFALVIRRKNQKEQDKTDR